MIEQSNHFSRRFFCTSLLGTAALGLFAYGPAGLALGDEISDKQAQADEAYGRLLEMQSALDRASNDYHQAIEARDQAQAAMEEAQRRIDEQSERIEGLQGQLSSRARSMYRNGELSFWSVLLGSTTFEEFATNWSVLGKMNERDADLVSESRAARASLAESKTAYAVQREAAAYQADQAESVRSEAEATVRDIQSLYEGLSAEVAQLIAEKQAAEATAANAEQYEEFAGAPLPSAPAPSAPAGSDAGSDAGSGGWDGGEAEAPAPTEQPSASEQPAYEEPADPEPETGGFGSSLVGDRIVAVALQYLGWDYVWGGKSPAYGGFDCSGFVAWCYGQVGLYAPSYTGSLIGWGRRVWDPQPGDVCVIHEANGSQHTGIYYGGGQMIHAATFGVGVIIGPVQRGMQYRRP